MELFDLKLRCSQYEQLYLKNLVTGCIGLSNAITQIFESGFRDSRLIVADYQLKAILLTVKPGKDNTYIRKHDQLFYNPIRSEMDIFSSGDDVHHETCMRRRVGIHIKSVLTFDIKLLRTVKKYRKSLYKVLDQMKLAAESHSVTSPKGTTSNEELYCRAINTLYTYRLYQDSEVRIRGFMIQKLAAEPENAVKYKLLLAEVVNRVADLVQKIHGTRLSLSACENPLVPQVYPIENNEYWKVVDHVSMETTRKVVDYDMFLASSFKFHDITNLSHNNEGGRPSIDTIRFSGEIEACLAFPTPTCLSLFSDY